jgi:hypothetical protein
MTVCCALVVTGTTTWSQQSASTRALNEQIREQNRQFQQQQAAQAERLRQEWARRLEQNRIAAEAQAARLRQNRLDSEEANRRAQERSDAMLARQREASAASNARTQEMVKSVNHEIGKTRDAIIERNNQQTEAYIQRSEQRQQQREEAAMADAQANAAAPSGSSEPSQFSPSSGHTSSSSESETSSQSFYGEHFAQTRTSIISDSEASEMSYAKLRYAINEVYARHGASFSNKPELRQQFSKYGWYSPKEGVSMDTIEEDLTSTERANIETLARYRDLKKGR